MDLAKTAEDLTTGEDPAVLETPAKELGPATGAAPTKAVILIIGVDLVVLETPPKEVAPATG